MSVIDAGLRTQPDEVVWQAAAAEGRAVVTYNIDDRLALSAPAYQRGETHTGLIVVSIRPIAPSDVGGLVCALDDLMQQAPDLTGEIVFLHRSGS